MSLREQFRRRLTSKHAPRDAAVIGAALSLPSLALGEFLDDHLLRQRVELGDPAWSHMDTAARGSVAEVRELGMFGWWAGEDFRVAFMRPLSGLTHALDHSLWPEQIWLMHLENVAIYALMILVIGRVCLRLFGPGLVTGLTCLAFAVDEVHAASVAWIAGRNTILAALFGFLALLAHVRWRAPRPGERRWPFALAGPLCFALALASAEAGIAVLGYLFAWAVTLEPDEGPVARPVARLAPLVPYAVIVVAWRLAFTHLGYGTTDSMIYTDPADAPLQFLGTALIRAPALSFTALALPLTDVMTAAPWTMWPLAAGFAGLAWALAPLWTDAGARFLAIGMLACTVPFAATSPSSRTMLILGLGGAGLFAMAWSRRREADFEPRARRWLVGFMAACQLVIGPLVFVPLVASANLIDRPSRTLAAGLAEADVHAVAVVLNPPTEISALYLEALGRRAGGSWPAATYVAYAGREPLTATRVDADSLELEAEAGWAAAHIDRLSRDWSSHGFAAGDRVELQRATVEILDVTPDGRPRRVRLDFDVDLDEVSLLGLAGSQLERWEPAIGEQATFQAGI